MTATVSVGDEFLRVYDKQVGADIFGLLLLLINMASRFFFIFASRVY